MISQRCIVIFIKYNYLQHQQSEHIFASHIMSDPYDTMNQECKKKP